MFGIDITQLQDFLLESIKTNQFFQGGFVLGILTGILMYFKTIALWIKDRIFRHFYYDCLITQDDKLYLYADLYIRENYSHKFKKVEARYTSNKSNTYIKEIDEDESDVMRSDVAPPVVNTPVNDILFVWHKWRFLIIYCTRERLEAAHSTYDAHYHEITVSGLFAKKSIKSLLEKMGNYGQKYVQTHNKDKVEIKVWGNGNWHVDSHRKPKELSKIYFKQKQALITDVKEFLKSKDWYTNRSLRYSRGYLLHGPPGNGKTSLIHSMGREFNKTVSIINLNNLTDEGLIEAMRSLEPNSILAFEDVDSAFSGRKNKDKNGLSFSTLLNCIDGTYAKDDIIVIFTTNHIEKLDPALIRPGRVDFRVKLENPDLSIIKEYVENFYEKKVYNKYKYTGNHSMSSVQNICVTNKNNIKNTLKQLNTKND
jgi:hypothetical protein